MQDRNPGNQSRLSELLDTIETPPENLQLDKNAAWEKLSARRDELSKRKNTWVLWPAAILLVLMGASLLLFREKPAETKALAPIATIPGTKLEVPSAETIRIAPPITRRSTPLPKAATSRRPVASAVPSPEPLPEIRRDTLANILPTVPETTSLAVIPVPKKKLKQVHLNELEPAAGARQDLLTKKEKKRFFLYMTTGSATSVETMAGGSDPQIKIKINNN